MKRIYRIDHCYFYDSNYKWLGSHNPVLIKYDEFIDILKNNLSEFNNSDNKPTQSTAYYTVEYK